MKRKKDNNLICVEYTNGEKKYFTSLSRTGLHIGIFAASVKHFIDCGNIAITEDGRKCRISIVDGSEVKYKEINNN